MAACPARNVIARATPSSGIVAVALDQNGLHKEAAAGLPVSLDLQEPDGNWADPRAGGTRCGALGFKSWTAMEHYRLTGDKNYLAEVIRAWSPARAGRRSSGATRDAVNGKVRYLRPDAARHGR